MEFKIGFQFFNKNVFFFINIKVLILKAMFIKTLLSKQQQKCRANCQIKDNSKIISTFVMSFNLRFSEKEKK